MQNDPLDGPLKPRPDLKVIEAASEDIYDLQSLRVDPETLESAGVRKLLTTIPVRKPNSQDFIRVRSEPQFREKLAFIELPEDREIYNVNLRRVPELQDECYFALLYVAISRQGVPFLWPVRLPGPHGKTLEWHTSAHTAAQHAMRAWIRVKSNMSLRAYEIFEAEHPIPDPVWPELSFQELFRIAFRDKVVCDLSHPVAKQLRGQ